MSKPIIRKNEINKLRSQYTVGSIIELIEINDKWTNLNPGDRGIVQYIDDAGQIHVLWFNQTRLALIPNIDKFRLVTSD